MKLRKSCMLRKSFKKIFFRHNLLVHAAVIAINEALEAGDVETTMAKLLNPSACLECVTEENARVYQERLMAKKTEKMMNAKNKVSYGGFSA